MEDEEEGVPSDRVLGMPVAAAMNPNLPQNCCEQSLCGRKTEMPATQRAWIWRICLMIALTVLMLGAVSDAMGSALAIWQASSYMRGQVRSRPALPPLADRSQRLATVVVDNTTRFRKVCPFHVMETARAVAPPRKRLVSPSIFPPCITHGPWAA